MSLRGCPRGFLHQARSLQFLNLQHWPKDRLRLWISSGHTGEAIRRGCLAFTKDLGRASHFCVLFLYLF